MTELDQQAQSFWQVKSNSKYCCPKGHTVSWYDMFEVALSHLNNPDWDDLIGGIIATLAAGTYFNLERILESARPYINLVDHWKHCKYKLIK